MKDFIPWINFSAKHDRELRRRTKGSALLVVLALLILCTIVLLAFISQSMLARLTANSSENSIKSDLLARAALDEIVLSLQEEIFAGSTAESDSGVTIYFPAIAQSALPSRSVGNSISSANTNFSNLLKQSSVNIPTYTNSSFAQTYPRSAEYPPAKPASSLSTATSGKDGRHLSARRWNSPKLLGGSGLDETQLPYWVYFTRSGPLYAATDANVAAMANRDATNSALVIGRYAYQIYDISGLLDVNLAGHPDDLSPQQVNELKGTLSGAVLKAIPQLSPSNAFMDWKAGGVSANQFFTNQITNTNSFLSPAAGERYFFNRQDLLRYASSTNAISTNALPYLTVFNRKKNAPVFSYPTTGQVSTNNINVSPLRVRMAASGSSTLDTLTWKKGDPVVPRRFPLSRLDWVRYNGPAPGISAEKIKSAFGLVWDDRTPNDTNPASLRGDRWVYVGSTGSDNPDQPASAIKTLTEVAQEGREPNFFELLKAAIHKGSLGQAVAGTFAPDSDALYLESDLQIFRIGACMIDQADADSYPTLINSLIEDGVTNPIVEVHGVENLPYISRIAPFYINPDWPNDPGPGQRRMLGFIVPELWNPHQPGLNSGEKPTDLRLFFTGNHLLRTTADTISISGDRTNTFTLQSGAAILSQQSFSLFLEPRPITQSTATRSGNFNSEIPFKTFPIGSEDPIVGAELQGLAGNMIARAPRDDSPETDTAFWNGYGPVAKTATEFWTRDYIGGTGENASFDAILQFRNFRGKFQNYNIFGGGFYTNDADLNRALGVSNKGSSIASGFRKEDFPLPYVPHGPVGEWERAIAPPLSNTAQDGGFPNGGLPTLAPDRWQDLLTIRRQGTHQAYKPDPRTARLGIGRYNFNTRNEMTGSFSWAPEHSFAASLRPTDASTMSRGPSAKYPETEGTTHNLTFATAGAASGAYRPAMFERNLPSDGSGTYYLDNDGVARPGDNRFQARADSIYNQSLARPVILNRPFRSVGELGFVFRDLPHKSLDLSSDTSVDAGLLDYFCVNEAQSVTAGVVNLNTAPSTVLEALLQETGRTTDSTTAITSAEAQTIAANFISRRATSPANELAALVKLTTTNMVSSASAGVYPGIKTRREAVIRSLSSVHNERTWNVFIDVIAQTGKFPPRATQLQDFIVEGERRYWLHIAIDRYTGEVVDELRELVLE